MSDLPHLELLQFGNGVPLWIALDHRGISHKAIAAAIGVMGTNILSPCKIDEGSCITLVPIGLAYAKKMIAFDCCCCGGHRCHFLSFVSLSWCNTIRVYLVCQAVLLFIFIYFV
jgi:hypothetical protein